MAIRSFPRTALSVILSTHQPCEVGCHITTIKQMRQLRLQEIKNLPRTTLLRRVKPGCEWRQDDCKAHASSHITPRTAGCETC